MDNEYSTPAPCLPTERLVLRAYRRSDFEQFAAHVADPVSMAHIFQADRATAWRMFCAHAGSWLIDGTGWWAVEERATGRLVGNVGAFYRVDSTVLELGWNTFRDAQGRGFGYEAAAAALHHALEVRREPKVRALIAPANAASLRVAGRLGLVHEEDIEIYGKTAGVHVRVRDGAGL